jgi:hypothetical protein
MPDPEKTMDFLESQIPAISGAAFDLAYVQALASGQRVLVSANDGIYEIAPDGTRTRLKPASAPVPVQQWTQVRIP